MRELVPELAQFARKHSASADVAIVYLAEAHAEDEGSFALHFFFFRLWFDHCFVFSL